MDNHRENFTAGEDGQPPSKAFTGTLYCTGEEIFENKSEDRTENWSKIGQKTYRESSEVNDTIQDIPSSVCLPLDRSTIMQVTNEKNCELQGRMTEEETNAKISHSDYGCLELIDLGDTSSWTTLSESMRSKIFPTKTTTENPHIPMVKDDTDTPHDNDNGKSLSKVKGNSPHRRSFNTPVCHDRITAIRKEARSKTDISTYLAHNDNSPLSISKGVSDKFKNCVIEPLVLVSQETLPTLNYQAWGKRRLENEDSSNSEPDNLSKLNGPEQEKEVEDGENLKEQLTQVKAELASLNQENEKLKRETRDLKQDNQSAQAEIQRLSKNLHTIRVQWVESLQRRRTNMGGEDQSANSDSTKCTTFLRSPPSPSSSVSSLVSAGSSKSSLSPVSEEDSNDGCGEDSVKRACEDDAECVEKDENLGNADMQKKSQNQAETSHEGETQVKNEEATVACQPRTSLPFRTENVVPVNFNLRRSSTMKLNPRNEETVGTNSRSALITSSSASLAGTSQGKIKTTEPTPLKINSLSRSSTFCIASSSSMKLIRKNFDYPTDLLAQRERRRQDSLTVLLGKVRSDEQQLGAIKIALPRSPTY